MRSVLQDFFKKAKMIFLGGRESINYSQKQYKLRLFRVAMVLKFLSRAFLEFNTGYLTVSQVQKHMHMVW